MRPAYVAQYSFKYKVGDLLMRWTANPQIGQYGKLAYKSTGPYEVVSLHARNPDVYYLKPLGKPDVDATYGVNPYSYQILAGM